MRMIVAMVLLAACSGGSGTDIDSTEQGICSNLPADACRANAACQLAYVDSGFQPAPNYMHCLALEDHATDSVVCGQLDREGCRSRRECSPLFWQELGPDDGPVGDPYYKSCETEADLGE